LLTTVATTNSPTKEDVAKLTCLRKPQTKINEELNTAKSELCEAASQRKVFEIIALFDEKDIESTAEMEEKAVSWNMANWKHKDDLAYLGLAQKLIDIMDFQSPLGQGVRRANSKLFNRRTTQS
jgi:hypothetical protein